MARLEPDAEAAQPIQPAQEEPRGAKSHGIDAPGGGGKGFDAQPGSPATKRGGIKVAQERRPDIPWHFGAAIARCEAFGGFRTGQVEPAASRNEKLAAQRGFRVKNGHGRTARSGDFRRAQTRRASADDGYIHGRKK